METLVRQPAVGGMFYPADEDTLRKMVNGFLTKAAVSDHKPKALIVPHAGYIYSGPVAASAYRLLQGHSQHLHRVLLLGPAHRMAFRGLALCSSAAFETPLGEVAVDTDALTNIEDLPQVHYIDEAHALEHSLEVHLPFLQTVLQEFTLIPIVVGDAGAEEVGEVIEKLWTKDTLVVISSDLSHYHDYRTAKQRDSETTKAIEALRFRDIHYEDACGRNPINGLLWLAEKKHLHVHTLDLRNSGDTAGTKDRVVGYGAYCIE